jgi:hypothetical protein
MLPDWLVTVMMCRDDGLVGTVTVAWPNGPSW